MTRPCPRYGCPGHIVVARIMRWCPVCKWTGLVPGVELGTLAEVAR